MKSYIASIGTAFPEHKFRQMQIAEFMSAAAGMNVEEKQRLLALYKATGIAYRHSVIPDFGNSCGQFQFFPNTSDLEPFPTVGERMKVYEKEALPLAIHAVNNCIQKTNTQLEEITHLITVSCTGMYAPGIDIEITKTLGLKKNIRRTCINYMGCYAAFNALKVADAFAKSEPDATILIVCVELCTIHYHKSKNWDDILSNAIFGDGAAAVLIQSKKPERISLTVESFYCDIAFEGKNDMAWNISDFGFEMTLSSYVPGLIKNGIKTLTKSLLQNSSIEADEVDYYAIHPGGKKILEVIEDELNLPRVKTKHSFEVLKEYGNMSSPTVLIVLEKIFNNLKHSDDSSPILSFAFGPGLTLESMLLKVSVPSLPERDYSTSTHITQTAY